MLFKAKFFAVWTGLLPIIQSLALSKSLTFGFWQHSIVVLLQDLVLLCTISCLHHTTLCTDCMAVFTHSLSYLITFVIIVFFNHVVCPLSREILSWSCLNHFRNDGIIPVIAQFGATALLKAFFSLLGMSGDVKNVLFPGEPTRFFEVWLFLTARSFEQCNSWC